MLTAAALALASLGAPAALANDPIQRQGTGERRETLNRMENQRPPAGLWDALQGAPEASSFEGKVVLIYTLSHWYPVSHRPLANIQRLYTQHADRGLVVLGVHHDQGFENAASFFQSRNVTFPIAHDVENRFRDALRVDQDPDFYVIDRAGMLRFADIETGSVARAVELLLDETREDAESRLDRLAETRQRADREARRPTQMNPDVLRAMDQEVPFTMPPASAFEAVTWPEHNTGQLSAESFQGKPLPSAEAMQSWEWFSDKPETRGRVVVLDFWATWCGPCIRAMPMLDRMQTANRDDLAIIAVTKPDSGQDRNRVANYIRSNPKSYFNAWDATGSLSEAMSVRGIPHVVVLSTDGVVRWQGNPHDPKFQEAVNAAIRVDPGVQARRAAREAHMDRLRRGG
jgi:thiol-disulfide isomerase/thioredoxin